MMINPVRRALGWIVGFVDDSMPMPPEQRDEREWTPRSNEEISQRRLLRLKLHLLEKRGKGGYR
jgi:hypothetical protein